MDGAGNSIAEGLDPKRYFTYLGEASVDYSFLNSTYYLPFGYPQGHCRVGPLVRLNVAKFAGTPRADREITRIQAARSARGLRIVPLSSGPAD